MVTFCKRKYFKIFEVFYRIKFTFERRLGIFFSNHLKELVYDIEFIEKKRTMKLIVKILVKITNKKTFMYKICFIIYFFGHWDVLDKKKKTTHKEA